MKSPNKTVETNRRPASPFNVERQFESASCAPPLLSAAVAHLLRSTTHHVMKTLVAFLLLLAAACYADDSSGITNKVTEIDRIRVTNPI